MKHHSAIARILLLACALTVASALAAGKPNFAGVWKMNPALGQNMGMMGSMQQTLTIKQSAKELTITEASDFQGQKSSRTVRYDLKGAVVKNEGPMGGPSDTVAKWEGDKLVATWTSPGSVAGTTVTRMETRSLSADRKTMTVVSARGTNKPVTMVYERQ
jgi:hypothetical protein